MAGETPAEDVDTLELLTLQPPYIAMYRNTRPPRPQHPPTEWVDLTEPAGFHPGLLEAIVETPDAREQRAYCKAIHAAKRLPCGARLNSDPWPSAEFYSKTWGPRWSRPQALWQAAEL